MTDVAAPEGPPQVPTSDSIAKASCPRGIEPRDVLHMHSRHATATVSDRSRAWAALLGVLIVDVAVDGMQASGGQPSGPDGTVDA